MDSIIIDLSSDEECDEEEDANQKVPSQSKKRKIDCIIVLTDEENDPQEDKKVPNGTKQRKTKTKSDNVTKSIHLTETSKTKPIGSNPTVSHLKDALKSAAVVNKQEIKFLKVRNFDVNFDVREVHNVDGPDVDKKENAVVEVQDTLLEVIREENLDDKSNLDPTQGSTSPDTDSPTSLTNDNKDNSDLSDETSTNCGDGDVGSHCSTNLASEASCSKSAVVQLPVELDAFLNLCKKNVQSKNIEGKLKSVRSAASRASVYLTSKQFLDDLETFRNKILRDPPQTAHVLVQLYNKFKEKEDFPVEYDPTDIKIDKLNKKLEKVKQVIDRLAEAEVDFENDENSNYMKYQKFLERADKIVRCIRKLEKKDPYAGIPYFSRLDFSKSKYNEFNMALNKKYNNRLNHSFPTFFEVDKCLRNCAKEKKLNLPEGVLKSQIELCFEELGRLLKRRRQKDLESIHSAFLPSHIDPAKQDPELEKKLRANRKCAKTKIDEILKRFTSMQDTGVDPDLSEDSDDSKTQDSDDEDDD